MRKTWTLLLCLSLLFISACSSFFKINVEIDNPTDEILTVSVDGKDYEITPKSSTVIDLVKGEHDIKANLDGRSTYEGVVSITNDGLLNLCNSTYVIHKEIYLADQSKYDEYATSALKLADVEINEKTYQNVDFEVYDETILVPKHWDYSVGESLPEEIKASEGEYAVISKLYRIDALEKAWGFYGDFDFSGNSDQELQQFLDSLNNLIEPQIVE